MEIINNVAKPTTFEELNVGDVFLYNNNVYIKTLDGIFDEYDIEECATNLATGKLETICHCDHVRKVKAVLTIESEV